MKSAEKWIRRFVPGSGKAISLDLLGTMSVIAGVLLLAGLARRDRVAPDPEGVMDLSPWSKGEDLPPGARHYTKIEPWGQDIDGDNIATTAEGEVDVDGDGRFTQVEMEAFGLPSFIVWAHDVEPTAFQGRVCSASCQFVPPYGFVCIVGEDPSVNCISNETGNCTGTVGCKQPCMCPASECRER